MLPMASSSTAATSSKKSSWSPLPPSTWSNSLLPLPPSLLCTHSAIEAGWSRGWSHPQSHFPWIHFLAV